MAEANTRSYPCTKRQNQGHSIIIPELHSLSKIIVIC